MQLGDILAVAVLLFFCGGKGLLDELLTFFQLDMSRQAPAASAVPKGASSDSGTTGASAMSAGPAEQPYLIVAPTATISDFVQKFWIHPRTVAATRCN